jgi:hypothetical protein
MPRHEPREFRQAHIGLGKRQFNQLMTYCTKPRAALLLDGDPDHMAQQKNRRTQAQNQGNGEPLSVYLLVRLVGKILQQGDYRKPACVPVQSSALVTEGRPGVE